MKILLLFATLFSLAFAKDIFDYNIEDIKFEFDKSLAEDFLKKYEEGDEQGIVAIINEYGDKIFENIATFAVENNLDPMNLTDIKENFLTASITLTNGKLNGIASLGRADKDITVSYKSNSKILEVYIPVEFIDLKFDYDYHVVILLIGPKGGITGEIKEFKMDIRLQFDFNTYQASVAKIHTSNKGNVKLIFHGNGVVDAVVNVLTEFVTTILQPLIGSTIENLVSSVVHLIVDTVNSVIDTILYPATSASSTIL